MFTSPSSFFATSFGLSAVEQSSELIPGSELSSIMSLSAPMQQAVAPEASSLFSPTPAHYPFLAFAALALDTPIIAPIIAVEAEVTSSLSDATTTISEHDLSLEAADVSFDSTTTTTSSTSSTFSSSLDGSYFGGDEDLSLESESSVDGADSELEGTKVEMGMGMRSSWSGATSAILTSFDYYLPIPAYAAPKGFNPSFLTSFELNGGVLPRRTFSSSSSSSSSSPSSSLVHGKAISTTSVSAVQSTGQIGFIPFDTPRNNFVGFKGVLRVGTGTVARRRDSMFIYRITDLGLGYGA